MLSKMVFYDLGTIQQNIRLRFPLPCATVNDITHVIAKSVTTVTTDCLTTTVLTVVSTTKVSVTGPVSGPSSVSVT